MLVLENDIVYPVVSSFFFFSIPLVVGFDTSGFWYLSVQGITSCITSYLSTEQNARGSFDGTFKFHTLCILDEYDDEEEAIYFSFKKRKQKPYTFLFIDRLLL